MQMRRGELSPNHHRPGLATKGIATEVCRLHFSVFDGKDQNRFVGGALIRPRREVMNLRAWIENRFAEVRYALRMVRKTPGATAIAVMSLALGIGANTAIFSIVDAMLLKLLPVKSPHELYLVGYNPSQPRTGWNYPDYTAFRDNNTSFSGLAAYGGGAQPSGMAFGDAGASTAIAFVAAVFGDLFVVLGVVL